MDTRPLSRTQEHRMDALEVRRPQAASLAILLLASGCLGMVGCATHKATINAYTDPSFSRGEVRSIAIFPIRNTRAAPSESQVINRQVTQALHAKDPNLRIVGPTEAVEQLNNAGLADDWADFLERYVMSGVPDAASLAKIGNALQCDAVMQGEVLNVFQEDGQWGRNKGQTRVTVRYTILDTRKGKLLWEASSDGIRKTALATSGAPPIIEAVSLAVEKILQNLPVLYGGREAPTRDEPAAQVSEARRPAPPPTSNQPRIPEATTGLPPHASGRWLGVLDAPSGVSYRASITLFDAKNVGENTGTAVYETASSVCIYSLTLDTTSADAFSLRQQLESGDCTEDIRVVFRLNQEGELVGDWYDATGSRWARATLAKNKM